MHSHAGRLVFVGMLQDAGLSLDDIDGVLRAGTVAEWKAIASERLAALSAEIERLERARQYLEGALLCRFDHPLTDCKIMGIEIDRRLDAKVMGAGLVVFEVLSVILLRKLTDRAASTNASIWRVSGCPFLRAARGSATIALLDVTADRLGRPIDQAIPPKVDRPANTGACSGEFLANCSADRRNDPTFTAVTDDVRSRRGDHGMSMVGSSG